MNMGINTSAGVLQRRTKGPTKIISQEQTSKNLRELM